MQYVFLITEPAICTYKVYAIAQPPLLHVPAVDRHLQRVRPNLKLKNPSTYLLIKYIIVIIDYYDIK